MRVKVKIPKLGLTMTEGTIVANLSYDRVHHTQPVFAGDTIYVESEILEIRPSRSRPDVGLVRVRTRGYNQDGVIVIEFLRAMLVYRRGRGPARSRP